MNPADKPLRILLLEDTPTDAELTECALLEEGLTFTAIRVDTRTSFVSALEEFEPDIILADYNLPSFDGMTALQIVLKDYPDIPVVMVTGAIGDEKAIELLKLGAKDYVLKDRLARLGPAVRQALSNAEEVRARKKAEIALQEKTTLLENVINSSSDYIFAKDKNLQTILCNTILAKALGKTPVELYGLSDIEKELGSCKGKEGENKGIQEFLRDDMAALSGETVHVEHEIENACGDIRYFDSIKVPLRLADGTISGILGVTRDITERKHAEQKLKASLAEKEVMMREIHHRVKNNLQTISNLLELQSNYVKDEHALDYFRDSQQRIQSMAMIHAQLYHNQDMAQIDFTAYLDSLVDNLRVQYGQICQNVNILIEAEPCTLPVDTAIPCGLVINELVSNALKHAFPNERCGELRIKLHYANSDKITLEVTDNGVGLPQITELNHHKGFGMRLIELMVEDQMHGKLCISSSDTGTQIRCEIGEIK